MVLGFLRKTDPAVEITLITRKIPLSGRFNPLDDLGLGGKGILNRVAALDLAGSIFVAGGAELIFGTYWSDPYLEPWQKGGQFTVAILGAGASWGIVVGVGALTGGPLGIGAALLVGGITDLIWNVVIGPQFNTVFDFNTRVRKLQPLKQN